MSVLLNNKQSVIPAKAGIHGKSKFLLLGLLVSLAGCVSVETQKSKVIERANFDLDCPKEQIAIQEFDNGIFGAKGCEKNQAYQVWTNMLGMVWVNKEGAPKPDLGLPKPVYVINK